jgi:hypothetical protein
MAVVLSDAEASVLVPDFFRAGDREFDSRTLADGVVIEP